MLILVLRVAFVVLATMIGMTSGRYFYGQWAPGTPPWMGGAIGFGLAVTLIAAEHAFRRRFARSVVAFIIGLGCGLAISALLLEVLSECIQDRELYNNLDLPVALVTTYLVMITVLWNLDRWRLVIPFVEFRSAEARGGALVVDGSVLADSRLAALLRSGLMNERVLLHRRVLTRLEEQARGEEAGARARAGRALEGLKELRTIAALRLEIDETEIPNAPTADDLVVRLCRLENARLVSNERELLRRAEAEGVGALDLGALAAQLAPVVRVGEVIMVAVEKPGEGKDQGVGHLDDGSMVVINGAAAQLGKTVRATVLRMHTTANGRMVFAEMSP